MIDKEAEVKRLLNEFDSKYSVSITQTEKNINDIAERIVKLFAIPVVVLPKGTLCACGLTADGTLYDKPMCEGCLHRNT